MSELRLKSQRFRHEREQDWKKLEKILARADRGSLRSLSDEELVALPVLYRAALSSLSVARATSLDRGVVDYLESLSTRAYFFVYGARTRVAERLTNFFARDWPLAVRELWRETLVALLLTAVGAGVSMYLVMIDPDWFYTLMPSGMTQGRDPTATTEFLRSTLYSGAKKGAAKVAEGEDKAGLPTFATFLFTHNAGVALFSFALGFAFCLPTAILTVYEGCSLGSFIGLFASRGLAFEVVGWISPHGWTETFAGILSSAAGFRVGWAVAFPGQSTRLEAAGREGRRAATVMCGVVVMLFVAGLFEGIVRQVLDLDWARYAIGLTSITLWCVYFYWPRRDQGAARG